MILNSHNSRRRGFTLIELMVVVGIIAIAVAVGLPAFYKMKKREALVEGVADVVKVCSHARALAIMKGVPMELRIYPQEGRFEVVQAPDDVDVQATATTDASAPAPIEGEAPPPPSNAGIPSESEYSKANAQLDDSLSIDMCDVNFGEYKEEELARVKFYPNGTSDDFTLVLLSDKGEYKAITLEVVTGLADVKTGAEEIAKIR